MRRTWIFAERTFKEVVRDPLTIVFGVGFPVALILMMTLMQRSISGMAENTPHFALVNFTPSMTVFGLSFIALFLGTLIANDRNSAFLARLFASPLTASNYLTGYSLPFIPLAVMEGVICFGTAAILGLTVDINVLWATLSLIPVAMLFIALGVIFGTTLTSPQVGGVGSIVVNLAAWLSGAFFDVKLIGGAFETICGLLPFYHAVGMIRSAFAGIFDLEFLFHLLWVLGYAAVLYVIAILLFKGRMRN